MAEETAAEDGATGTGAPVDVRTEAPGPAPLLVAPGDLPTAIATPAGADVFSLGASALGHLLIGLVVFGSLASVQRPPDVIPVKLIPADQVPQKPEKPVEPQPAQTPKPAQPPAPEAPPPPKAAAEPAPAPPDITKETPPPGKADTTESAKTPETTPWKTIAESLGLSQYGRKTTLPDTVLAELTAQVKRCWAEPTGWTDPRQITVTLRFQLQRDGTLDGDPAVVEFPATPIGAASAKAAMVAVTQCGPFRLPAAQYDQWKDIQLKLAP